MISARVRGGARPHPDDEGGFVLPIALLVLVLLSMITAAGLYSARNDFRAAEATRQAAVALAAADAGASRTVATWSAGVPTLPAPGDSLVMGWQALPDGSEFRSVVFRAPVGAGESAPQRVTVRTTGRVRPPGTARRTVVTLVEVSASGGLCCGAAFKVRSALRVTGPRRSGPVPGVDGTDQAPPGWPGGWCPGAQQDIPGILSSDTSQVELRQTVDIAGAPPIEEDSAVTALDFTNFGSVTYDSLAALADAAFTGNQRFRNQVGPVVVGGVCATGVATNWGSPQDPGGPCGDYAPVVHVAGNLVLQGTGQGQGTLLVDGDLTIDGDFWYYGLVIVQGRLSLTAPGGIYGAVLVRGGASGTARSEISDGGRVLYSSCAVQRGTAALPGSGSGGGSPAVERSWFEVIG